MQIENWERMMKRQEVILKALQGELNWIQVAEILDLTARQVRRIKKAYSKDGSGGLIDRRRNKPPRGTMSPKRPLKKY